MGKLIDEKVLQAYFKERFSQYIVEINGNKEKITGVTNGPDFPDLYCTINGRTVHCEVEWLSSNFFKHKHHLHKNFTSFKKNNGFLLVFDKDEFISDIQQIVVDEKDFRRWFNKNSGKIFDESVEEFKSGSEKRRKTAKIWIVYNAPDMKSNFLKGKNAKTWGWRKDVPDSILSTIEKIKVDDILIFFGPTINTGSNANDSKGKPNAGKSIFARMKGTYSELYRTHIKQQNYEIENITICKIKKSYWNEESSMGSKYRVIWSDETISNKKYPHRVKFGIIFELKDLPLKKLNDAANEFLRTRMQGKAIGEMSYSNFIELIRK